MSQSTRHGSCLCGQVQYDVAWPPQQVMTCQCTHCQKQSGSSISVIAMVRSADLSLSGELARYEDHGDSGNALTRCFCPRCGSPVLTEIPGMRDNGLTFIKAGTLDDPSGLAPTAHLWTASAQDWMVLPETGVKLERQ